MNKSRKLKWADHIAKLGKVKSTFNILTDEPTGKRPVRRPRLRWEDNIRMDLKEIGMNTRNLLIQLRIKIIGEPL